MEWPSQGKKKIIDGEIDVTGWLSGPFVAHLIKIWIEDLPKKISALSENALKPNLFPCNDYP